MGFALLFLKNMPNLTSSIPPIKAIFALDVTVAILATFFFVVALLLVVTKLGKNPGGHARIDSDALLKNTLATQIFLVPGTFFLALKYAVVSATVALQIQSNESVEVTTGYSYTGSNVSPLVSGASHAQVIAGLSFTAQIAEIIFTLCLTGAVWIHSSHITNNGTGLAQPSRRSKIWNTSILLSILGTGIAAWGLGLDPEESKQVFQSPFSYTTAVRDDQAVRIVYIVFRVVVIFASGSVSIEVLRKWINLKNNGKPGNPERPVLQRFTFVVVPLIWLRDVFIIMSIVMVFVSADSWTETSREALAFLLIIFGQYANLIIVFMVLWGSWSMGNSLEAS
ncbi:hypothetical protein D6C80_07394 [Aureobasidium pullulans]|nr:hypothetical protein D6C80_07394 [Aureobasidium pullulans]